MPGARVLCTIGCAKVRSRVCIRGEASHTLTLSLVTPFPTASMPAPRELTEVDQVDGDVLGPMAESGFVVASDGGGGGCGGRCVRPRVRFGRKVGAASFTSRQSCITITWALCACGSGLQAGWKGFE